MGLSKIQFMEMRERQETDLEEVLLQLDYEIKCRQETPQPADDSITDETEENGNDSH